MSNIEYIQTDNNILPQDIVEDSVPEATFNSVVQTAGDIVRQNIIGSSLQGGSAVFGSENSVLKFDETSGIWLGNASFASAPFSVSLAGALTATSATISGTITATSGTIGGWTINASTLSATNIILDSGNQKIQVGATNPIIIDGVAKEIESDNYVSGIAGAGFHLDENLFEVGNIEVRGLIRTALFQKDVVNVMGGNFIVLDGDVLDEDMTALDTATMTVKGNTTFVSGDILRIKDGTDDEWFQVV